MGGLLVFLLLSGSLYIFSREFIKEGGMPAAMCYFGVHTFDSWTYIHENTCEQHKSCSRCGKGAAGPGQKVEHLWMPDYLHERSCEQQDMCLRCKERRGAVTVEHTWQPVFMGDYSNQKYKICRRCSSKTAVEVADTPWPWMFEEGTRRRHFLLLQQALQELSSAKDMFFVAGDARGGQVKIVRTVLPNTNVVLRGFSMGSVDYLFYPDGLHAVQKSGRSTASIEIYSTLSFHVSRVEVEEDPSLVGDAEVIERSWQPSGYSGSPEPASLAILAYALFTFVTTEAGTLQIAISNSRSAERFHDALAAYVRSTLADPREREPRAQSTYSFHAQDHRHEPGRTGQTGGSQDHSWRAHAGEITREASYTILGVRKGAARAEIRRAYLGLAKEYHPDRVFHLAGELKTIAEERMKEINAAYDLLKDR